MKTILSAAGGHSAQRSFSTKCGLSALAVLLLFAATACQPKENNFKVHRGTNLSHWLSQSEVRGEMRSKHIQEDDMARLESLGFDFVRIPIDEVQMWDEDGNKLPEAWDLLTNGIDLAIKHNLRVVVDLHIIRSHYFNAENEDGQSANTLFTSEESQQQLINMWYQLSEVLRHYSVDSVAYEFMNEPVAPEHDQWNQLIAKVHKALREVEPQRTLVIGSNLWQGVGTFQYLRVPENDKNIILSFHFYEPMVLTHYNTWWNPIRFYTGDVHYPGQLISDEDWDACSDEVKAIVADYHQEWNEEVLYQRMKQAIDVADSLGLQLFCGEWGVYENVDREWAYAWTRDMIKVFNRFNVAWCTWCYDADFGFYDQFKEDYKDRELINILMEKEL